MPNNIHCRPTHVKPAHTLREVTLLASQTFPSPNLGDGTGLPNMAPTGASLELLGVTGRQVWVVLEGIAFLMRMCLMVFHPGHFFH